MYYRVLAERWMYSTVQKWATPHFFIYLLGNWEIGALVYFYLLNYVQTNMKVQHKKQKQILHNSNDLENEYLMWFHLFLPTQPELS